MSSNEQNYHLSDQAGSITGAFSERGRAAENAYFHAVEAQQLDALKQQQQQSAQQSNQTK